MGFIKRRFRRLVQSNLLPVGFQKGFAVPGFPISSVHITGLGIVDDVSFQHGDFGQPRFCRFDGIPHSMITFRCRRRMFPQFLCATDFLLLQEQQGAQVINLLEDLQAELGITYLFIAHDLSVVKHISDRIIVMYLGKIMEIAPCEELYSHPLHPYTRALLSAVPIADPKVDKDRERIEMLGEVPSVMNRPAGCPFSNRCRYATERCRTETPPMRSVGADHSIACFLDL